MTRDQSRDQQTVAVGLVAKSSLMATFLSKVLLVPSTSLCSCLWLSSHCMGSWAVVTEAVWLAKS